MTILTTPKDPDTPATYEIDIRDEFIVEVRRNYQYPLNDVVRDQRGSGFLFLCTKAGTTGRNYPEAWPRAANEIVRDGSAEWTSQHPLDVTVPTIQSVTWIVPTGLTLDSQSESDHSAKVTLSGGTDGQDYDVTARITPTTGSPRDVTMTIPVRQQ